MPWNDTAQLNFLLPEFASGDPDDPSRRPQVPDHPVDAAMTLARSTSSGSGFRCRGGWRDPVTG